MPECFYFNRLASYKILFSKTLQKNEMKGLVRTVWLVGANSCNQKEHSQF